MAHAFAWLQVGSGDNEVKLTLVPGAAVSGRVVDDQGKASKARTSCSPAPRTGARRPTSAHDAITTGKDGAFRFAAMPAGSFRFVATHAELAPGTSSIVTLDGKTERAGITITLAAGAVVRGKVIDGRRQGRAVRARADRPRAAHDGRRRAAPGVHRCQGRVRDHGPAAARARRRRDPRDRRVAERAGRCDAWRGAGGDADARRHRDDRGHRRRPHRSARRGRAGLRGPELPRLARHPGIWSTGASAASRRSSPTRQASSR